MCSVFLVVEGKHDKHKRDVIGVQAGCCKKRKPGVVKNTNKGIKGLTRESACGRMRIEMLCNWWGEGKNRTIN